MSLFFKKFSTENQQNTIAKLYLSKPKKDEKLKAYFTKYDKYLQKYKTAVKRKVRYVKRDK